jgi:hypothetical protein
LGAKTPPIAANIAQKFPILQKLVGLPEFRAVFNGGSARSMNPVGYEGFFHRNQMFQPAHEGNAAKAGQKPI